MSTERSENLDNVLQQKPYQVSNIAKLSKMSEDINPLHAKNFDQMLEEIGKRVDNIEGEIPKMLADAKIGDTALKLGKLNSKFQEMKSNTTNDAANDDHYEELGNVSETASQNNEQTKKAA